MASLNSFRSRDTLTVDGQPYTYYRLDAVAGIPGSTVARLPFSLRVLLENLLRNEDGGFVKTADIEALAKWDVKKAVDELSGEVAARMIGKGWDKVDRRGMAFMQAAGVQFTSADPAFVKVVGDKTAPLIDTWAKAAEGKGLKNAKQVLADYRAEIAKLQK